MSLSSLGNGPLTALLLLAASGCAASTPEPNHPAAEPASSDASALRPSREEIHSTFAAIADSARACSRETGTVHLAVVFGSDGTPTESRMGRTTIRDPEALECIVELGRGLRVRPFTKETFSVSFPYRVGP